MVEEKTEGMKQLFVYEHDAKRLELFIRIVYALRALPNFLIRLFLKV
jgi:hypothetical protein